MKKNWVIFNMLFICCLLGTRAWAMSGESIDELNFVYTPLMEAAVEGNLDSITELLAAGADIDKQDKDGNTALMLAIKFDEIPIAKYLVWAGANLQMKNKVKDTAYSLAIKSENPELANLIAKRCKQETNCIIL